MRKTMLTLAAAMAAGVLHASCVCVPDAAHSAASRRHTGIPSLAVSAKGRLWVTYYGGPTPGEDSNNYCVLATSADGGESWKDVLVADPDGEGPLRAFDPEVWVAPDGRLLWTWTERVSPLRSESGHANAGGMADPRTDRLMCLELPGDEEPAAPFPRPRQVSQGIMMCKPIVRDDGAWLFPVARWKAAPSACFCESWDGGRTFADVGGITLPAEARLFDEHAVVQLKDGGLLAFVRTTRAASNCVESVSVDGGRTWSGPKPARIRHTSSRLFMRRLAGGEILLVKHGKVDEDCGRRKLMAFISRDEGVTWEGGLILDERGGVSYPDGDQAADGLVHVVYDHDRLGAQEVLIATFRPEDVLAGRSVSGKVRLRRVVTSRRIKENRKQE